MNTVASPGSECFKTSPLSFLDLSPLVAGVSAQAKLPPLSLRLEENMNPSVRYRINYIDSRIYVKDLFPGISFQIH